jgi:hypothetical protein
MPRSAARRRWIGSETCSFCLQTYVVELEWHCLDCDRPLCPSCVIVRRLRAESVCPACGEGSPGAEGD